MTRTPKQEQQWKDRFLLGTLLGLSRWIASKQDVIRNSAKLSHHTRMRLLTKMDNLSYELCQAAYELGWKGPKL